MIYLENGKAFDRAPHKKRLSKLQSYVGLSYAWISCNIPDSASVYCIPSGLFLGCELSRIQSIVGFGSYK